MTSLDQQMRHWSTRLNNDLKITPPASDALASTIAREVLGLSFEAKNRVRDASLIPLGARLEEMQAFQGWMDIARESNRILQWCVPK
jgi:hypothetical protein